MEKISLIKNEEGLVCRKEIVESIVVLDDNQLVEAKGHYDNLLNQREEAKVRLNQLDNLIGEFNGVFDEVETEKNSDDQSAE